MITSFQKHDRIALACHSLGGLIARKYLLEEVKDGKELKVDRLLLYAVPNNGAGLASVAKYISWRHGQLAQLCRESDLIEDLSEDWHKFRMNEVLFVRYGVAGLDRVVSRESAQAFWGNPAIDVVVDRGHRDIVKPADADDLAFLILKDVLLRGRPNPLPRADAERFTVALTHLEKRYENLIFEGLNERFDSQEKNAIQFLRFDRTIERGGADLEASVNEAHQQARAYLEASGADVLIWGSVLQGGDESIPKLYWIPSRDVDRARDWGRYATTEDLELPEVFWEHLAEILQLLVVTRDAEFRSLKGQFVADRLGPFVEKVRTLLTSRGEGWSEDRLVSGNARTLHPGGGPARLGQDPEQPRRRATEPW